MQASSKPLQSEPVDPFQPRWYEKAGVWAIVMVVLLLLPPVAALIPLANYCSSSPESDSQSQTREVLKSAVKQRATKPESSSQSSRIFKLLESMYAAQEAHYKVETEERRMHTGWRVSLCDLRITDALIATFTYWLAVITAGLIYTGVRQETYMRRSWKSARVSAGAAVKQTQIAQDTARRELRAYLGVRSAKISILSDNHLQAIVEIHNTGSTPAHDVTKSIAISVRDSKNPGDFPSPERYKGRGPIVPGAWWTFRVEETGVTRAEMEDIYQYKKSIFVWGEATYRDAFGESQILAFRYRNLAAHQTILPEGRLITGWDVEPEEEGNSST